VIGLVDLPGAFMEGVKGVTEKEKRSTRIGEKRGRVIGIGMGLCYWVIYTRFGPKGGKGSGGSFARGGHQAGFNPIATLTGNT